MLEQLKRPFKKRYDKVREKAGQYVGPVKESASKLFAMLPKMEAFAGSEDLARMPKVPLSMPQQSRRALKALSRSSRISKIRSRI